MAARIVLFGPTGFTGDLTVKALVEDGHSPLLIGRNQAKLTELARRYGGLETATADATKPGELTDLVNAGDVLVSLSGPFTKVGYAALEAATTKGAHYIDSTGEPPFIRDVFEKYGPQAKAQQVVLLTAMGYDYVPGNLAALHALQDAGPEATTVQVGYFVAGPITPAGLSGGTRASLTGALFDVSFQRRDGVLVLERPGMRHKAFDVDGKKRDAISLGTTENFTMPQEFPNVRTVESYLGWFGPASRYLAFAQRTGGWVMEFPPFKKGAGRVASRFFPGSTGGPSEEMRAKHKVLVVAQALNGRGQQLGRAVVGGISPYDFTGNMLSWSAQRLLEKGPEQVGALGPATAFGREVFIEGARTAGIHRVE